MNLSIKKGKYLAKLVFAISSLGSKRLHNGMVIGSIVVSLLFNYFPALIQRNISVLLLSILSHHKVLLDIWENLRILPVCFPTKKILITTNSRKLCFSFPSQHFHVKSVTLWHHV